MPRRIFYVLVSRAVKGLRGTSRLPFMSSCLLSSPVPFPPPPFFLQSPCCCCDYFLITACKNLWFPHLSEGQFTITVKKRMSATFRWFYEKRCGLVLFLPEGMFTWFNLAWLQYVLVSSPWGHPLKTCLYCLYVCLFHANQKEKSVCVLLPLCALTVTNAATGLDGWSSKRGGLNGHCGKKTRRYHFFIKP